MAFVVTVGGVDYTDVIEDVTEHLMASGRGTATIVCGPEAAIPAPDAAVLITRGDGVTPLFGGLVRNRPIEGFAANTLENRLVLECTDYGVYADWCDVTLEYTAPVALETVLAALAAGPLAPYGVTYTTEATGITFDPFRWDNVVVAEALRQLHDRTKRLLRFSPAKALTLRVPGADAAPVTITDGMATLYQLGRGDHPRVRANVVKIHCGPPGEVFAHTQTWYVQAGDTTWVSDVRRADTAPWNLELGPGGVFDGTHYQDVGLIGSGKPFEFNQATATLYPGTYGVPAVGTGIRLSYWSTYPFTVQRPVTLPAVPRFYRDHRPSVTSIAAAIQIAEALLAALDRPDGLELSLVTDVEGWDAGQALSVNTTARGGVVDSFLVESVTARPLPGRTWEYTVQASQGDEESLGSHQDEWRRVLLGGSGGGSGSVGPAYAAVPVLPPAVYLGGSSASWVSPAATWARIPDANYYVAQASFTGRVRARIRARNASVSVQARLVSLLANGSIEAVVGTSDLVTSQTATEVFIVGAIVAGKVYALDIANAVAGEPVGCVSANLESV